MPLTSSSYVFFLVDVKVVSSHNQLQNDLQIPSNLRQKLAGMESTVKAAMLKSSTILAKQPKDTVPTLPHTPRGTLRRAASTESFGSLRNNTADQDLFEPPRLPYAGHVSAHQHPYHSASSTRKASSNHTRGFSFDTQRFFSRSQVDLATESCADLTLGSGPLSVKDKGTLRSKNISPTKFCSILTGTSSLQLDIEDIKKLRLLLRNESAR